MLHGTGGMFTKLQAAEIASEVAGCTTIICRGIKKTNKKFLKKHGTILKGRLIMIKVSKMVSWSNRKL